jgi:hypothetical protein
MPSKALSKGNVSTNMRKCEFSPTLFKAGEYRHIYKLLLPFNGLLYIYKTLKYSKLYIDLKSICAILTGRRKARWKVRYKMILKYVVLSMWVHTYPV